MGRPKVDPEILKLRGTYRPDRHAARVAPPMPADADEEAALDEARTRIHGKAGVAFFDRLRAGLVGFDVAELELLVQAARLTQLIEDAEAEIRKDGLLIDGRDGGRHRHPAAIIASGARTELRHTLKTLRPKGE
jgi:hypothetical protein